MRERKVKTIVPDSFELPDLHDAVAGASLGDVEERVIDDTYHDTPDLRLARWGCTLRHRSGDGWTVKIPRPSKGVVLDREEVGFGGDAGRSPGEGAEPRVVADPRRRRRGGRASCGHGGSFVAG